MAKNAGSRRKLIHEKIMRLKISCLTPFNVLLLNCCRHYILHMKCYILPSAGPGLRAPLVSSIIQYIYTVALVHDSLLTHMFMHMTARQAENMIIRFQVNSCQAPVSNSIKSLLSSWQYCRASFHVKLVMYSMRKDHRFMFGLSCTWQHISMLTDCKFHCLVQYSTSVLVYFMLPWYIWQVQ
jgi:hypothetical protein